MFANDLDSTLENTLQQSWYLDNVYSVANEGNVYILDNQDKLYNDDNLDNIDNFDNVDKIFKTLRSQSLHGFKRR